MTLVNHNEPYRDDYLQDSTDPSLQDLGQMLQGADAITDNDIGF